MYLEIILMVGTANYVPITELRVISTNSIVPGQEVISTTTNQFQEGDTQIKSPRTFTQFSFHFIFFFEDKFKLMKPNLTDNILQKPSFTH